MELSDELLEQIGAYLSGQFSANEKAQFDARLQQDPELQQEVAIQREIKQGLSFLAQKDRFKQMHADLDQRKLLPDTDLKADPSVPALRTATRYGWARWAMAASLVLAAGIGWLVYSNQREKRAELAQNERVFNTFFSAKTKPTPAPPTDPDRVAAPLDTGTSTADLLQLQAAINTLQNGNEQAGINELKILSARPPGHWSASAQWYLALAYLRANQRVDALPLLQKISQVNGHPYQREATQLLTQLSATSASEYP